MELQNSNTQELKGLLQGKNDYIAVKPACDFFGLDYNHHSRTIKDDPTYKGEYGHIKSKDLFGDERSRFSLTNTGFMIWISSINPKNVNKELQDKFIEFKKFALSVLVGASEADAEIRDQYRRLEYLKHWYGKLGSKIQSEQKRLNDMLQNKYVQSEIDFGNFDDLSKVIEE